MPTANEVVSDYYQFLKQRDHKSLVALLAQDIVVTYHGQTDQLPWAGEFRGIEGFDRFFQLIREHLDIIEVTITDSISTENKVINQCKGAWQYKNSGYVVRGSMLNIFTIDQGKIAGYDVYADTAAFVAGYGS